jgi:O-antigen/teichoic acid export membrane protein
VQGAISVSTSVLAAIAYFLFRPGMPAGSDLAVAAFTGLAGVGASFWLFQRLSGGTHFEQAAPPIRTLLGESRPYWILALAVYCYSSLQIPLVAYFADRRLVGAYRSALMLATGLELLYNCINSLLLPRLVVWRQMGSAHLWLRQKELLALFAIFGSVVSFVVIALAPLVYRKVLGPEFADAVAPFRILVVGRLVVFVGQIFVWSLVALHLDRQFFMATMAGAIFSVCANIIVIPIYGIKGAAIVSLLSESIIGISCFVLVRQYMTREKPIN